MTSNKARTLSKKMVILMTDGEWNEGRDPVLAAQDAAKKGIVVHTISMLTNKQTILTQIASITGGRLTQRRTD
ncbi:MAG: VWA domain-containing protein [Pirellulales bacterium]